MAAEINGKMLITVGELKEMLANFDDKDRIAVARGRHDSPTAISGINRRRSGIIGGGETIVLTIEGSNEN